MSTEPSSGNDCWCLTGGAVHDPVHGVEGLPVAVWVDRGRIVSPPRGEEQSRFRRVDCSGRIVMPGAIDMHSHVAGPKVNAARKMLARLGLQPGLAAADFAVLPAIGETARRYLALGYTTVMDAAVAPLGTRAFHREIEQFEGVDAGCYLVVGNNHRLMECVARNDRRGVGELLAWLLDRCGGWAPKIVNPGGVEHWKRHRAGRACDLDEAVDGWNTTPRSILRATAEAARGLSLPHPLHVHGNNLGLPGNWRTTLESLRTLEGLGAHFAHVQFHSYGGEPGDAGSFCSMTGPLVEWVNAHPEHSVDVGQVVFGNAAALTGDIPVAQWLADLTRERCWTVSDETGGGCGIAPLQYSDRNLVHAIQWATGLEWMLGVANPWQIALTTDHPNGGCFESYPLLIRLLMDSSFRREAMGRLPARVRRRTALAGMDREYSLQEIAIVTRAAPARLLGLADRGHLGPGAVADIAIYTPQADRELMFRHPWMVFRRGRPAVVNGTPGELPAGETLVLGRDPDPEAGSALDRWFGERYSIRADSLGRSRSKPGFQRRWTVPGTAEELSPGR